MKRFATTVLLALAAFGTISQGRAAPYRFTLDAQESHASFVVGSTLHKVHGTLYLRDGEIRFDDQTGEASGEIVVDATRTETGNAKRDKKMHGKVLLSESYPTFVFDVHGIRGRVPASGTANIDLLGEMTVAGDAHPVTIPISLEVAGGRVDARAEFPVPYVEWGLKDPSVFLLRVNKVVDVTLEAHGALVPAP